jgi:hypothetical protein
MDTLTESITAANETALKALTSVQEQILAAHRELSARYAKAFDVPGWVPSPTPLTDVSVDSFVEQAYEFQAQKLEADKQFAVGLVNAWTTAATKATKSSRTSK